MYVESFLSKLQKHRTAWKQDAFTPLCFQEMKEAKLLEIAICFCVISCKSQSLGQLHLQQTVSDNRYIWLGFF